MTIKEKKLLSVLNRTVISPPPIWVMRQAGRYLPEYRKTRQEAGGFLNLCYDSARAKEVTLQPIRRYHFDAAILFADILLIPHALGQDLWFDPGDGPRLAPLSQARDVDALRPVEDALIHLRTIGDSVAGIAEALPDDVALIGFAGAPWTVMTYMIAGRGKDDQAAARAMAADDPALFDRILAIVENATVAYLVMQIDRGAEVVKLFDSWAGALRDTPDQLRRCSVEPMRRIAQRVRAARPGAPIILFPRGVGDALSAYADIAEASAIAIDESTSISRAIELLGDMPLQGNLSPNIVIGDDASALDAAVDALLRAVEGRPHIVNLGHGVDKTANPDLVGRLVDRVRGR